MASLRKSMVAVLFLLSFFHGSLFGQGKIVDKYGQLSVKGSYIIGEHGDTVQLRGMSFFWSQWMGQYYNAAATKWLRDDWKCTVVRPALGVEPDGYRDHPEAEKKKIEKVVDAAIDFGMYVIIDYHSHEAHKNLEPAKKFFAEMAQKYGSYPNVMYEIYNEPLQDAKWSTDIKPYADSIVATIRKYDPDNIIIVGTRQWSQMVSEAAADPIKDANTAYTLHFYAATHGKWLREEAKKAMNKGIALVVTEYGTCDASGNTKLDLKKTQEWYDFLDQYKISYCNWSVADKEETASALMPGSNPMGGWTEAELTPSGQFVRANLIAKNTPIFKSIPKVKKKKEKKK